MVQSLKHFVRDQPLLRAGALRAGALVRSVDRAPPGVYTLCYHHVRASSQDGFAAQLAFFKRHGRFIDADTAVERVIDGRFGESRYFVLTLDDGYLDNVEVALPVLQAHGIPAMLFLVSDWLDRPPADGQAYMGRREVDRWLSAGLHIGSHSASHRRLSRLSQAEVRDELERSAAALAALANRPVGHFACPWGVPNIDFLPGRDAPLATAAGYRTFFTTTRGRARSSGDLLRMPRHVVEPEWAPYELDSLLGGSRFARA